MKKIAVLVIIMFLLQGCGVTKKLVNDDTQIQIENTKYIILGDSIAWLIGKDSNINKLTNIDWANRGIGGNTTEQVLARLNK